MGVWASDGSDGSDHAHTPIRPHDPIELGGAMDQAAAARFLAERYGVRAREIAELGGGDWSRAFSFRLDHRDLVVRFGRHLEDFRKDQRAMAFRRPELPVPRVLG